MKTSQNNIRLIILQCIGLILSGCTIYGYAPIGIGYFAALYSTGRWRVATFATTILGLAYTISYTELIKYSMVIVAYAVIIAIMEIRKNNISPYIHGLVITLTMSVLEITDRITDINMSKDLLTFTGVCVLAGTIMIVFRRGIDGILESGKEHLLQSEEMIGIATICSVCIYYFVSRYEMPYSILESVIYFLLLYCAYRYGAGLGAIIGAGLGIALGIEYNNLNIVSIMCITAILVGGLSELGKVASVIAMICVVVTGGLIFVPDMINEANIQGILTASIVFLMLPSGIVFRDMGKEILKREVKYRKMSPAISRRLGNLTESLNMLYNSVKDISVDMPDNMRGKKIIKTAMDNICAECDNCSGCTYKNQIILRMMNQDNINLLGDMTCPNIGAIENEINYINESSRINEIWQGRINDIKNNISMQIKEVSTLVDKYSGIISGEEEETGTYRKKLQKRLRSRGVSMCEMRQLRNTDGLFEIEITLKCDTGKTITTRELSEILENVTGYKLVPDRADSRVIGKDYRTLVFRQAANFKISYGISKSVKGGGKISGDNQSISEIGNGKWLLTLADGMGSGIEAFKESESVVETLEKMMESGFGRENAVNMLNSIKAMNWKNELTTSLDMGVVDMYSGIFNFIKMGGASTFIKRDRWIDVIRSTSLPMGIVSDSQIDSISKKLYVGDMVIMMSDGVLDGIKGENKELEISRILLDYKEGGPKELADRILEKAMEDSYYTPLDDMTVVVVGLHENVKSA